MLSATVAFFGLFLAFTVLALGLYFGLRLVKLI